MKYRDTAEWVRREFVARGFEDALRARKYHAHNLTAEVLSDGTALTLAFPGYKSNLQLRGRPVYDYRVDICIRGEEETLSHANIIVDLFAKGQSQPSLIPELRRMLLNVMLEGQIDICEGAERLRSYRCGEPPGEAVLHRAVRVHRSMGKVFNASGNRWKHC